MSYLSDSERWNAYEFSDPFAAGVFYVCNLSNSTFCRPDCSLPIAKAKSDIFFVNSTADALQRGYFECLSCDPLNVTASDLSMLVSCVAAVNKSIGFSSPSIMQRYSLDDPNKHRDSSASTPSTSDFDQTSSSLSVLITSVPTLNDFSSKENSLSKNDADHIKIVDLACRHLASAAASAIFSHSSARNELSSEDGSVSPGTTRDSHSKSSSKKKKRGGVLGFKELAAKLKLLAWHFHRVFKLVTGLTPKTYGDKCWEYLRQELERADSTTLHTTRRFTTSSIPVTSLGRNSVFSRTPPPIRMSSVPASPEAGHQSKKARVQLVPSAPVYSVSCPSLAKVSLGTFDFLDFGVNPLANSVSFQREAGAFDVPQVDIADFSASFQQFSRGQSRVYSGQDQSSMHDTTSRPLLKGAMPTKYSSSNIMNNLMLDVGGASETYTQLPSESPLAGDLSPSADVDSDANFSAAINFGSVPDYSSVPLADLQYQHDFYENLSNHASPHYRLPEDEGYRTGAKALADTVSTIGIGIVEDDSHFDFGLGLASTWSQDYLSASMGMPYV